MKKRNWIILILILISLTACNETSGNPYDESSITTLQAWIDAPLNNAQLPLLPYSLVFHGAGVSGVDEFEVLINTEIIATVPAELSIIGNIDSETLYLGEYLWTPPAPGMYLISVQAIHQEEISPADYALVMIGDEETDSAPLADQVEPDPCIFTALQNLFCRQGPDQIYPEIDSFIAGQSAPVVGISTDGFHWYVIGPNFGQVCAVPNNPALGTAEGDCDQQPITTAPPTPTPGENPEGCTVRQAGGEIICVSPCPEGANPGTPCRP